jgi:hypothetical protein
MEGPLDGINQLRFLDNRQASLFHQRLYPRKLLFSAIREGPWKLSRVQDQG